MSPAITVLIPAYNAASTIEAALTSVLNQDVSDWEVVVADDGSTDGTLAVVDRVRKASPQGGRIVPVALKHGGCASATHGGIVRARTDIVTVLDADDMLYPHALRTVLGGMDSEVCYLWTRFAISTWDKRGAPNTGWAKDLPPGYPTLYATFMHTNWWAGSHQRAFRRSVYLERTPMLDQQWQVAVDLQLCLLMAGTRLPTKHVPTVSYWYRKHAPQMSATSRDSQRAAHREMLLAWRKRCS